MAASFLHPLTVLPTAHLPPTCGHPSMPSHITPDNSKRGLRNGLVAKRELPKSKTYLSPPVTRITIPNSPLTEREAQVKEHLRSGSSASAIEEELYDEPSGDDSGTPPPVNEDALDDLWKSIRQKKEKRMTKDKCKVDSLSRRCSPAIFKDTQPIEDRLESEIKAPVVKREKSVTSFIQSPDGRTIVASFNMRGVPRENIHVSFQGNRLVVTWVTIEVSEWVDDEERINRERIEKNFQRTLPLPEGTKVEEITCAMSGRYLLCRFPNSRSFRVENRPSDERR